MLLVSCPRPRFWRILDAYDLHPNRRKTTSGMMAAVDIGSVLLGRQRVNLILGNNTLHSFAKPLDESSHIDRNPLQSNEKI